MEKYSIGKVAKLCHISIKTLRYYDEIDVLKPAFVNEQNGYRYYTNHEIHKIALIKYYKELGFKLDHIKELIKHYELNTLDRYFEQELLRIEQEIEEAQRKYFAIKEWKSLVQQGRQLKGNLSQEQFTIQTMPSYTTVKFTYNNETDDLVIDNGFVYSNAFVEFCQRHNYYTYGPFILRHPNLTRRLVDKMQPVECFSEVYAVEKCAKDHIATIGDIKALTYIHKGDYKELPDVYEQMQQFAREHHLQLRGDSYERYIIDSWSTLSQSEYLTEVLMPLREEE